MFDVTCAVSGIDRAKTLRVNFRRSSLRPEPLIFNVTSLVDILMVLAIFLIGSWSVAKIESDVGIRLPTSQTASQRTASASPLVINVRANGEVTINQRLLDDPALMTMMEKLAKLNPDQVAIVRADRKVEYERILQILDLCGKAGVKDIGFSATPATAAE